MADSSTIGQRLAANLRSDLSFLLYVGPPFYCGWLGTGVIVPIVWWGVLGMLAVCTEYRPGPNHNELKTKSIAFSITLVVFVSLYYLGRWLAPT
jgi:hypothetical protein